MPSEVYTTQDNEHTLILISLIINKKVSHLQIKASIPLLLK